MRPALEAIFEELLARHRAAGRVHLNDLAEVIGGAPVSQEEIEALIDRLEAERLRVGEDLDDVDVDAMRAVLAAARRLARDLGRRPTVEEIARDLGLTLREVRRSLEHASLSRSLARPGPEPSS